MRQSPRLDGDLILGRGDRPINERKMRYAAETRKIQFLGRETGCLRGNGPGGPGSSPPRQYL